jgi:hypothetical protein
MRLQLISEWLESSVSSIVKRVATMWPQRFRVGALANRKMTKNTMPQLPTILDGGGVALEVLQAIGYRTVLTKATIVSYNMQDYDFWGQGNLSRLLLRQLSLGASVRLLTTPPPGKPTGAAFRAKYLLLSELQRNGVEIFLNEKLHAKAYLFWNSAGQATSIIGSANLTGPGFGMTLAPHDSLVEMAIVSEEESFFLNANGFVDSTVILDKRTEDYATWFSRNSMEIGKAGL